MKQARKKGVRRITTGSSEVFRRSALTLVPHGASAVGLTLAALSAAGHFGLPLDWAILFVAILPLAWAAGRGLQWAAATWTATPDGNLIVQAGILSRQHQVIPLGALRRAHVRSALPNRWGDVGHLAAELIDHLGEVRLLEWRWLARADTLQQIICSNAKRARGTVPRPRQTRTGLSTPVQAAPAWQSPAFTGPGTQPGDAFGEEYQHFLEFCQLVLTVEREACWPPAELPLAKSRRWMSVLRQARIIRNTPNGRGWRVADTIHCLGDVTQRVGQRELEQAMQRPLKTRSRLRQTG